MSFIEQTLKGIGQIMLQENILTGLLFLIGLFLGSWQAGLACLIATMSGTFIAKVLKFGQQEINSGLYGFSPALVGVVLIFFFEQTVLIWILIIVGGIIAAIIQHLFIIKNIPAYTFPFILVAWLFIFIIQNYTDISPSQFITKESYKWESNIAFAGIRGYGQVIFQGTIISGFLFLIGVGLSNIKATVFGVIAAFIGAGLSFYYGQELTNTAMGLFSFNAVLTAIALTKNERYDILWITIGVLFTLIIDNVLVDTNILSSVGGKLTFPFVAGTWITLVLQKKFKFNS